MRIVNSTGNADDTLVYDDDGNELNARMGITKVVITVVHGLPVRAELTCEDVKLDLTQVEESGEKAPD